MNEQTTPTNGSTKNSGSTFWAIAGVVTLLYLFSGGGNGRGNEAAADATFREWAFGQVDNT